MNKMNKVFNSGDLVYIPSEVLLYSLGEDESISGWIKLSSPQNLLVTRVHEKYYEVYYKDEKWMVDKDKTYEVKNEFN